jgi:hypothetical protein
MRTKTLLLTAALSAAGLATSMAQVYSVNAVGYVNTTVPGGNKLAILANPLNGTNNSMNTTMPLNAAADGVLVFRWDTTIANFRTAVQWYGDPGVWFSPDDENPTINPGEAFWFQNTTANPVSITFVGEVPQGNLSVNVPGGNNLGLLSSQVPQSAPLGDRTVNRAGSLEFPAADGDIVYVWNVATQSFKEPYQYYLTTDFAGWFSPNADDPGPAGPVINVATGFWSQKTGAAQPWSRTFSVN